MGPAVERVGPVIIGAGVIGLAVARRLSAILSDVLILERNSHFGSETSARNSEVVHGGLYYPCDSYKARFCVQGREQLYRYCDDRQIEYWKMGKLVVATAPDHLSTNLTKLHQQAETNGYRTTRLMSAEDVKVVEPSLRTFGALWSPETGVVDSHGLMLSFLSEAEEQGASLAVQSAVDDAKIAGSGEIQLCIDGTWISSSCVINCAGLWADRVARMMHRNMERSWHPPRQYYCRGNYFRLTGVSPPPFTHLIYPVPDRRGGLGVHATLDRSRQVVKFGPDVEWLDSHTDPDQLQYITNAERSTSFYDSIRSYWPDLPDDSLEEDYVGVRPKLSHPDLGNTSSTMAFQDFVIAGPKQHGIPGLVHLLGIESPGLTSSMAVAEYVVDMVQNQPR